MRCGADVVPRLGTTAQVLVVLLLVVPQQLTAPLLAAVPIDLGRHGAVDCGCRLSAMQAPLRARSAAGRAASPRAAARTVPLCSTSRRTLSITSRTPMCRNWKAFGPTSEHNDGDADFYRLTDRLSSQYGLFQPNESTHQDADALESPSEAATPGLLRDPRQRPEFGLSQKQIAALGLSGPQMRLPDPVRHSLYTMGLKMHVPLHLGRGAAMTKCVYACRHAAEGSPHRA
eukprot:349824-Chlamydomonas_euryale.AAC.12